MSTDELLRSVASPFLGGAFALRINRDATDRSLTLAARMVETRPRSEPGAQATGQDPALALGVRIRVVLR
ncbi:MAG: hypothetical protein Q7R41_03625 [Phycisphaerales bacterium]|nr:hypothetical protein [Phycisphaerales bacterium]